MTDDDLDLAYTSLCRTMTRLGEANATAFLARLALLSLARLESGPEALRLIAEAAVDLVPSPDGETPSASPTPSPTPSPIPSPTPSPIPSSIPAAIASPPAGR